MSGTSTVTASTTKPEPPHASPILSARSSAASSGCASPSQTGRPPSPPPRSISPMTEITHHAIRTTAPTSVTGVRPTTTTTGSETSATPTPASPPRTSPVSASSARTAHPTAGLPVPNRHPRLAEARHPLLPSDQHPPRRPRPFQQLLLQSAPSPTQGSTRAG